MSLLGLLLKRLRRNSDKTVLDGTVRPLMELAYSSFQRSDYVGARELILKALEHRNEIQDPAVLVWLLYCLALTWDHSQQYREWTNFFSKYINQNPNDAIAYTLRAASLWYSGDLRMALDDYMRALELDPRDAVALSGRGQVLVECGEFRKGIQDLDAALENLDQASIADPGWRTAMQAYTRNGRAAAYGGLGEFERALDEFEKSISLCPQNAWVYYNRAGIYENRGDKAKAVADYNLALTINGPKLSPLKRKYAEMKVKTLLG